MKKSIFIGIILFIAIAWGTSMDAHAYLTPDGSGDNKVEFWNQGSQEEIHPGCGGCSFQEAGCSTFSALYMAVKTGHIDPSAGENIDTFKVLAREKNMYQRTAYFPCYYFAYDHINELYPDIEYVGRSIEGDGGMAVNSGMPYDDAVTCIKKYMNDGYYVVGVIVVSGTKINHCIFFDGINEDGTISIGDSGYTGITLEDAYGNKYSHSSMSFSYVEIMKCDKHPSNTMPSIYDGNALRDGSGGSSSDEEEDIDEGYARLVAEWELVGMPEKTKILDGIDSRYVAARTQLPYQAQMDLPVVKTLQVIKENRDARKVSLVHIISVIASFLGILLISYDLVLLLAYYVDRSSPFNLSFVKIISFGSIKLVSNDVDLLMVEGHDQKGYITPKKFYVILGVIFLAGGLLLSGKLIVLAYKFATLASEHI